MSATGLGGESQPSFTLQVSESKLDQAPKLSQGTWSQISQASWRDQVNRHFGVSSSSTGGAESPSGSGSGSSGSDSEPRSGSGSSGIGR
ncbi:MAG TPA: hypothetical protein PLH97_11915 [Verrucomicrobiota bacterium]|nr:hypothetical protein [Verrucomicrobiota bacterium]HPU56962.1 hypothetical protein [Verrucomicrobiota bacterium]